MHPRIPTGLLVMSLAALACFAPSLAAEPGTLDGSWNGNGKVRFASGSTEAARCRATFKQRSPTSFGMIAHCATASAEVNQTAVLRQDGANKFTGDFKNSDYGVTGTITITVSGNSLTASLSGENGGSGEFRLSK